MEGEHGGEEVGEAKAVGDGVGRDEELVGHADLDAVGSGDGALGDKVLVLIVGGGEGGEGEDPRAGRVELVEEATEDGGGGAGGDESEEVEELCEEGGVPLREWEPRHCG
jgi:hypothetical protein